MSKSNLSQIERGPEPNVTVVPAENVEQIRSALSYAVSLVDYHAPLRSGGGPTDLASGAANCRRSLVWLKEALK